MRDPAGGGSGALCHAHREQEVVSLSRGRPPEAQRHFILRLVAVLAAVCSLCRASLAEMHELLDSGRFHIVGRLNVVKA